MNTLHDWARKWNVPPEALADLRASLTNQTAASNEHAAAVTEAGVQTRVRLAAAREGWLAFRNNVGAVTTDDGRFLRFGLANDSARMNESIKSSDVIGLRPVVITPLHIGRTLGQFIALECKRPGWTPNKTLTKREIAQEKFLALIQSLGGHAIFTTGGIR